MEPISVPGPPKSAFNKNRCASDLIKKQVEHFKHLEYKLPPEIRATLPQHAIVTEDDAARYIGPMTRFFLSRKATAAPKKPLVMRAPASEQAGLAIAASAETDAPAQDGKHAPPAGKKSSSSRKRKT